MLKSGNDAAVALAIHTCGSVEDFAEKMNQKAEEFGLQMTHFVTPHGLDQSDHYTTAYELAIITDQALKNPTIQKIVATKNYTIQINNQPVNIGNTNELLGYLEGVNGVKTGFTNGAGRCLVTSVKRGDMEIISVVLGADSKKFRTTDSIKMIEYAYANYKNVDISETVQKEWESWYQMNQKRIVIKQGKKDYLKMKMEPLSDSIVTMKKQEDVEDLQIQIITLNQVDAPIQKDKKVGYVKIKLGNTLLRDLDILVEETVEKKEYQDYLREILLNYLT